MYIVDIDDGENRLVKKGDIVITNDKDGNTLTEKGTRYEAKYEYNGQNRMVYSEVTSHSDRTRSVSVYDYDALGRRTLTQNVTGQTLRTVYDGRGFEVIREGETFRDGSLTTSYSSSAQTRGQNNTLRSNEPTGERYRWIGESGTATANGEGYAVQGSRYGGRGVTLYGNGEAVAVSYSSSAGGKSVYLGKDLLGSVKSATADGGSLEDRYEYDAFGQPYAGDLDGMMNLGYTGKPYDAATGLYNYGYRDYRPQAARFTTVDPIRDGSNWYSYVNNDPVNWVDPWGLSANDGKNTKIKLATPEDIFTLRNPNLDAAYDWAFGTSFMPSNIPPGINVDLNMMQAKGMGIFSWYSFVKNEGPWDFKQWDKKYEDFGNFNFGATGTALGIPPEILLRGAG
jgi:RHS repeat-associated protein